ncbi:MAG: hypothetical protein JXA96_02480 [Sedimentisphaerales bacterium]|nr:hypothetical protein [Sedimentisphaerales bacterium]
METDSKEGLITRYINHISDNKIRILIIFMIYVLICFVACSLGMLASFAAQPGGITQKNAFIAPLIGPWSQTLPPNSHPVRTWSEKYKTFAVILAIVLPLSMLGSFLFIDFLLSYTSTVIAILSLILWILLGLGKVLSQLA